MRGVEVRPRWGRQMCLLEGVWQMQKEHEGVGTGVMGRERVGEQEV